MQYDDKMPVTAVTLTSKEVIWTPPEGVVLRLGDFRLQVKEKSPRTLRRLSCRRNIKDFTNTIL